jgi:hypothetical protein
LKKKQNILELIKTHVRPHVAFRDESDKLYNNHETEIENDKSDWDDKIKRNAIVGVKIKWKF